MNKLIYFLFIALIVYACKPLPHVEGEASKSYFFPKQTKDFSFVDSTGTTISFKYFLNKKSPSQEFRDLKTNEPLAMVKVISSQYDGKDNLQLSTFTDFRQVNGNLVDGLFITQNITQCDLKDFRVDFLFPSFDDVPKMNHLQLLHYEEQIKIKHQTFEDVFVSPKRDLVFKKDFGLIAFVNCSGQLFVAEKS